MCANPSQTYSPGSRSKDQLRWGRPFRLQSALLDCHSPLTTPVQIESGWMFSSILTGSGDVLFYWPYRGNLQHFIDANDKALNKQGDGNEARASEDGTIPCVTSVIRADPYRLPPIPALPNLPDTGLTQEQLDRETKLIKIAAYDNNLIGLTNKGHVLKFGGLGSRKEYLRSRWEYLPNFSEAGRVCSHPTSVGQNAVCEPPKTMRITHMCLSAFRSSSWAVNPPMSALDPRYCPLCSTGLSFR